MPLLNNCELGVELFLNQLLILGLSRLSLVAQLKMIRLLFYPEMQ